MCLASLLYHHQWIFQKFMVNHVVHCCCIVFCDDDVMRRCNENPEFVVVLYPWNNAAHMYSGVSPYVAMLPELALLQSEQRNLIDNFVIRVKTALQEYGIDSEWLTVENLNRILDNFRQELNTQLQTI